MTTNEVPRGAAPRNDRRSVNRVRVIVLLAFAAICSFLIAPTCQGENPGKCGSAGAAGCPGGTVQVCQDQCVAPLPLGAPCTGDPCHPCDFRNSLACTSGTCQLATAGGDADVLCDGTHLCPDGSYCSIGPYSSNPNHCSTFVTINNGCDGDYDTNGTAGAFICEKGLVCDHDIYGDPGVCHKKCGAGGNTQTCPCVTAKTGGIVNWTCSAQNGCCSARGSTCANNGECCMASDLCDTTGHCNYCVGDFATPGTARSCSADSDCCSGTSHCVVNPTTGFGQCQCTGITDTVCTSDSQCCYGLACYQPNQQPADSLHPGKCVCLQPNGSWGDNGCVYGAPTGPHENPDAGAHDAGPGGIAHGGPCGGKYDVCAGYPAYSCCASYIGAPPNTCEPTPTFVSGAGAICGWLLAPTVQNGLAMPKVEYATCTLPDGGTLPCGKGSWRCGGP